MVNNVNIINKYKDGIKDGVPIGLAYLSVSFAFGLAAKAGGLSIFTSVLISLTNLTSAGQFAGLDIIKASGAFAELALTTLVINLRYMLMSLTLSQRVDENMSTFKRMVVSFGINDEIFAVICQKENKVGPRYFLGLMTLPVICWSLGTFMGAGASMLLPESVRSALGIAIYGMFIGIIIPPAKKYKPFLITSLFAVGISCLFRYVPFLNIISGGWVIIISAVISAAVCAYLFPIKK